MKRLIFSALVGLIFTSSALAGDLVIPYVLSGSTIFIQNDGGSDLSVTTEFNGTNQISAVRSVIATRKSTTKVQAPATGYLKLSSPGSITAWTVIEGATFQAVPVTGLQLSTTMRRDSGFSLANPWDEDVTVSFTVYVNGGEYVTSLTGILMHKQTFAAFAGNLLRELIDGQDYVVLVHSVRPLALGVAQPGERGGFEFVPVTATGAVAN